MAALVHPYREMTGGAWLRGNLHTHTTQSDGATMPQAAIDDYAGRGYGFLMLADHDILTSEETYRKWNDRGMILIPGNEIGGGSHLLHVDADRLVASRPSRQDIINEIVAAQRETGRGFAIVNHPNWGSKFDHATVSQMREWSGYVGMEIFNGVITGMDGSPYATNKWDMLLSEGRRLWGFANDDSHHPRHVGLGWNMAYVKERSRAGVVEALRNGRFYCSTGVVISAIQVEGTTIRLETENAQRICALRNTGARFASVDDRVIEIKVPDGATYVRFECWGAGEQFAWTQPFFVVEDALGNDGISPFLMDWRVSPLLEHGSLATATPGQAETLQMQALQSQHSGANLGMADVRQQISGRGGIVYLVADALRAEAGMGVLKLGYDGPIRVWVNGAEVFHGPGTNPAIPDRLALYVAFQKGLNRIVVALDSNGGKAWGIFGKVE